MLSAPCADFDFQLAEACAAEDESSAEKLDCAELFAEEGRGYDQGGERINVAYKRRGLRRELLQGGKIHVVGKPGVDKAYDEDVNYIFPRYSRIGINILAWMRSHGVKVVLFTSNNDLPVKAYGDVCFNCSIKSVSCKNSLTAPMCLTNYLVAELALRNYEEAHDVLSRTEEILSTGFYLGI